MQKYVVLCHYFEKMTWLIRKTAPSRPSKIAPSRLGKKALNNLSKKV